MELKAVCTEHIYNCGSERYKKSLINSLRIIKPLLTVKEFKKFVDKDLQFNSSHFNFGSYIQSSCELSHIVRMYAEFPQGFLYEPNLNLTSEKNKNKDVDFSFVAAGVRFNVEVKCFNYRENNSNKTSITALIPALPNGDLNITELESESIEFVRSRLLNIRDFFVSANDKFGIQADKEFNILSICCYDLNDYIDVLECISGHLGISFGRNELFQEYAGNINVNNFKKIDAVVVCNLGFLHKDFNRKSDGKYLNPWDYDNSFALGLQLHKNSGLHLDDDIGLLFKKIFNIHNDLYINFCKKNKYDTSSPLTSLPKYIEFLKESGGYYFVNENET